MKFRSTRFPEAFIVEPEPHRDERGFLARTFCQNEFARHKLNTHWVQQNHTRTVGRGSVRGMHFQAPPHSETKLVRCTAGTLWDVIVDVRPQSPTFGLWDAVVLSSETMNALYIPEGFAHGFQCMEDSCELLYLMSEFYRPELARGVQCQDADIGIKWPHPVLNLSPRDAELPALRSLR